MEHLIEILALICFRHAGMDKISRGSHYVCAKIKASQKLGIERKMVLRPIFNLYKINPRLVLLQLSGKQILNCQGMSYKFYLKLFFHLRAFN